MLIAITSFIGAAPRINPQKLPPDAAQVAMNVDFTDGTLGPIREPKLVHVFETPVFSIFKDDTEWLGFTDYVNVVRGPVAQNRLYYTGDGAPKMRVGGSVYPLAIPAPISAPTVTALTSPTGPTEDVLYCYTWVTSFGEESQPSPLSAVLPFASGVIHRVSGFAATPAGRSITHRRIYRSQTSITGATELFFVAEIAVAATQYDYNSATTPLGEAILTKDYDPPPAGLSGLTQLPNGMMAAFEGRDLYFCEPFIPHAWPEKYVITVNAPIVGLAAFGSSLAVLTTEAPYVVQGLAPDQMVSEVVETALPCLSGRGIVDTGYSAIYPSTEGLVLIGEGRRELITETIFSREQWFSLNPGSIAAGLFKDQYVFIHNSSAFDTYDMGDPAGWGAALEDELIGGGPVLVSPETYTTFDFGSPFSTFGEQTISWIDAFGSTRVGLISSALAVPVDLFSDPATKNLYFLAGDYTSVYEWMPANQTPVPALWRSKMFSSNTPVAPGAFYVKTSRSVDAGDTFRATIYADGVLLRQVTRANAIERLPAAKLSETFEVEIETTVPVIAAYIAETPDEIRVALQ